MQNLINRSVNDNKLALLVGLHWVILRNIFKFKLQVNIL